MATISFESSGAAQHRTAPAAVRRRRVCRDGEGGRVRSNVRVRNSSEGTSSTWRHPVRITTQSIMQVIELFAPLMAAIQARRFRARCKLDRRNVFDPRLHAAATPRGRLSHDRCRRRPTSHC